MTKPAIRHLTEDQKLIVAELSSYQTKLCIKTISEFCRRYVPTMSDSTYRHLVNDDYTGDTTWALGKCRQAIANLKEMVDIQADRRPVVHSEFYRFPVFESVFHSIKRAIDSRDDRRAVVLLGPTGSGKSAIINELVGQYGAIRVVVKPSWRYSFYAAASDICRMLGVADKIGSSHKAELELLKAASRRKYLFAFDEGNTLGPQSFDVLKMLINETPSIVFLTALGGLFDQMKNRSWYQASQFVNRCESIIDIADYAITAEQAEMFAKSVKFDGDRKSILNLISDSANRFGKYKMIKSILSDLAEEPGLDKTISAENVIRSISICESKLRLTKKEPQR